MSHYGRYGATPSADNNYAYTPYPGTPEPFGSFVKPSRERNHRRRMNICSVVVGFFVPVGLFTLLFTLMSSKTRYDMPWSCDVVLVIFFGVVLAFGVPAFNAVRKKGGEPTWLVFLFLTCLMAWLLALIAGEWNFTHNMQPYYQISNLNTYSSVDPALVQGRELMDAGRVVFTNSTHLDIARSIGFRSTTMYCVAPLTSTSDNVSLATYDFWAVGTDCCQSGSPGFRCGDFTDPRVHAGLRLMRDEEKPFYRLAVEQAEAAYNIKAQEPLFFEWMMDPNGKTEELQDEGHTFNGSVVFSFIVLHGLIVVCAAIIYAGSL